MTITNLNISFNFLKIGIDLLVTTYIPKHKKKLISLSI